MRLHLVHRGYGRASERANLRHRQGFTLSPLTITRGRPVGQRSLGTPALRRSSAQLQGLSK
eukprot:387915-Prymnesium_polylepis.1